MSYSMSCSCEFFYFPLPTLPYKISCMIGNISAFFSTHAIVLCHILELCESNNNRIHFFPIIKSYIVKFYISDTTISRPWYRQCQQTWSTIYVLCTLGKIKAFLFRFLVTANSWGLEERAVGEFLSHQFHHVNRLLKPQHWRWGADCWVQLRHEVPCLVNLLH